MKKIVVVAGDKSGDLYGGHLCKSLKETLGSIEIYSFGGPHLAQYSQQLIDLTSHSVTGIFEVIRSLPVLLKLYQKTLQHINRIRPDLVIVIDMPDFNMRLIKALNKRYPVFYYISPQIWAWRKNRIKLIKKYVDKMIVIFEFEKKFYQQEGVDVLYFGHPLLEIINVKSSTTKKVVSFMPGSRKNEIARHLPLLKEAQKILKTKLPDYNFQVIRPANIEKKFYLEWFDPEQIVDHSYETISESMFIIACSGTATVEIAILEVPFIIIYKVNFLTWKLIKRLVRTQFAGMVNILAGKSVVRELLQKEATAGAIAQVTLEYLSDQNKYTQLKSELKKIKTLLSPNKATEKFSAYIGQFLGLS